MNTPQPNPSQGADKKCPDCGGLPGLYPNNRCPVCYVKQQHQESKGAAAELDGIILSVIQDWNEAMMFGSKEVDAISKIGAKSKAELQARERRIRAEAKHEQRHQALGVSRWILVGEEHDYWKHPMTRKKIAQLQAEEHHESQN